MTVNNERSSRNSNHRRGSSGSSVYAMEQRNRNSMPHRTHALVFRGCFQGYIHTTWKKDPGLNSTASEEDNGPLSSFHVRQITEFSFRSFNGYG